MAEDGGVLSTLSRDAWLREPAPSRPQWTLEAHAIVSADGRIADEAGNMPEGLIHGADQSRFQAALDAGCLTVIGRDGHERHPRFGSRRRLVLTSRVENLEQDDPHVWFWNPAGARFEDALTAAAPEGGVVVVTGGTRVFETCLEAGLHAFDLTIAHDCTIPTGRPCLSGCDGLAALMTRLSEAGLRLRTAVWLDPHDRIELRRFSR